MKASARRAGILCGGLVGGCSALISVAAHSAAGGTLPGGAALTILTILCATVGAATSVSLINTRTAQTVALIAALGGGQALGHVALSLAETHHGSHSLVPSAPMLAAHAAAAVALGLLIHLVGHLYVVCASVLTWLSLIAVHRGRPSVLPWAESPIVVLAHLLRSALRMRAPPEPALAGG